MGIPSEQSEMKKILREKRRGYADFYHCPLDKSITEIEVMKSFEETMESRSEVLFSRITARGEGMDPPDCEAIDFKQNRVAIEITELVDGEATHKFKLAQKNGHGFDWPEWNKEKFISYVQDRITEKSSRYPKLKGGPYPGGYVIVIYTDEFYITSDMAEGFLEGESFSTTYPCSAYFMVSYEPKSQTNPYFKLELRNQADDRGSGCGAPHRG